MIDERTTRTKNKARSFSSLVRQNEMLITRINNGEFLSTEDLFELKYLREEILRRVIP